MGIKSTINNIGKIARRAYKAAKSNITQDRLYKYDTKENREDTCAYLLAFSDGQRASQMAIWEMDENYYNNAHDAQVEMNDYCESKGIPSLPAVIPEPFIHCEAQIIPELPDFQFRGRDDDGDGRKARSRQYVVQYVLDNNDIQTRNTSNERRLVKYGDAIWKVFFDANKGCGKYHGDISILDVPVYHVFPDPTAIDFDRQEYHGYVYPMHRIQADREFAKDLANMGMNSVLDLGGISKPVTIKLSTEKADIQDDVVQVIEWWFKQPKAGSSEYTYEMDGKTVSETVEWEAGDIACSIIVNDTELRYIPCYWQKTHHQNKMYPFAKYSRMPKEDSFWGRSEIEPIKELVDAIDRELSIGLLNDQMMGNDIIIEEETAIPDGEDHVNEPGAIWKVKDGRSGGIKRMGGLSEMNEGLKNTVTFLREVIKQVTGNFDVNMGAAPPSNVNTLGGMLTMQDNGNRRQGLKKAGRMAGFDRLYRLIDWTAIEFYDDNRLIYLGATGSATQQQTMIPGSAPNMDRSKGPIMFEFNSDKLKQTMRRKDGSEIDYWPIIDCIIDIGDGIKHSSSMTVQALESLVNMQITPKNYKIVIALVDKMQLPDGQEIREFIEQQYAPQQAPAASGNVLPGGTLSDQSPSLQPGAPEGGGELPPQMMQLLNQLDPKELAAIRQNPQLLDEFMKEHQMQGIPPQMMQMLSQLDPKELAALRQNPQLLDEFMQEHGLGQPGNQAGQENAN